MPLRIQTKKAYKEITTYVVGDYEFQNLEDAQKYLEQKNKEENEREKLEKEKLEKLTNSFFFHVAYEPSFSIYGPGYKKQLVIRVPKKKGEHEAIKLVHQICIEKFGKEPKTVELPSLLPQSKIELDPFFIKESFFINDGDVETLEKYLNTKNIHDGGSVKNKDLDVINVVI